jgi:hypothetical protein
MRSVETGARHYFPRWWDTRRGAKSKVSVQQVQVEGTVRYAAGSCDPKVRSTQACVRRRDGCGATGPPTSLRLYSVARPTAWPIASIIDMAFTTFVGLTVVRASAVSV